MTRYDIYDQQLNPGDQICYVRESQICCGKIHSISVKGVIRVYPYNDEKKMFSAITQQVRAYKIIKVTGIIAQIKSQL